MPRSQKENGLSVACIIFIVLYDVAIILFSGTDIFRFLSGNLSHLSYLTIITIILFCCTGINLFGYNQLIVLKILDEIDTDATGQLNIIDNRIKCKHCGQILAKKYEKCPKCGKNL